MIPATELMQEYAGQPAKGMAAAEDLLRRFPNDLSTLESAARLYEQYGETARARDCLKRALSAEPARPPVAEAGRPAVAE